MYKKRELTEDEKYMQIQIQLEKELTHLKREFGTIDLSRAYKPQSAFEKTTKVVKIFAKEHENILTDLSRAADPGRKKEDAKLFDRLNQLLDIFDWTETNVHKHKVYKQEVEGEIKTVKKSLHQLRKHQITDRQYEDRCWAATKTIEALENKLETQMIKFGTICAKNKQLRLEIDHLLCERKSFLTRWLSFIRKLCDGKKIMLDMIEQATITFNQREDCCNKLQVLRNKAHQDLMTNVQEMREIKRKHDNNTKLEEFYMIKGRKRVMKDLQEQVREKARKRQQNLEEKLCKYQDMVEEIQAFVKEPSISNIARNYIVQEERNISNFRFIIEAWKDMEIIGDQLGTLHLDIEERTVLHASREDQQKSTIENLDQSLEDSTADATAAEEELKRVETKLDKILKGVGNLFNICKCSNDPIMQLLGDHTTVRDYNVHLILELLEDKIQWLLIAACFKDSLNEKRRHGEIRKIITPDDIKPKVYPIEKIVKITPCSLCVEREMVTDVIDVLQHVYTREQARKKLQIRLNEPGGLARIHNISHCQLPKSRGMMQKRYE